MRFRFVMDSSYTIKSYDTQIQIKEYDFELIRGGYQRLVEVLKVFIDLIIRMVVLQLILFVSIGQYHPKEFDLLIYGQYIGYFRFIWTNKEAYHLITSCCNGQSDTFGC
eukprot:336831_1